MESHDFCRKGSAAYEQAREALVWNRRLHDIRAPDVIVKARSAGEVAAAVDFARSSGLRVSVRGSGHDYQASALREGGILIDLGPLDGIEIDASARQAWVGAGVSGGAVLDALAKQGFAFPVGHCPDVALSGYLLAGGFGWNFGEWGPACLSVSEIELVTAAGEVLRVSKDSNPDLFWAARGSGSGFFAVVTRYRLQLYPLPAAVHLWTAEFPLDSIPAIAGWLDSATLEADSTVEVTCVVGPGGHSSEPSVKVQAVATGANDGEVHRRLSPFRAVPPHTERAGQFEEKPMRFTDLPELSAMPDGKRVAADYLWADSPPGELLKAVQHLASDAPPVSVIDIFAPGGGGCPPIEVRDSDCALSVGCGPSVGFYGLWDDPSHDERHLSWVRAVDNALAPHRRGRYVGESDLTVSPDRPRECFSTAAFERLLALKRRHDPEDRFFSFLT